MRKTSYRVMWGKAVARKKSEEVRRRKHEDGKQGRRDTEPDNMPPHSLPLQVVHDAGERDW